jgi:sporulation protein YlmC with PRC-barrel domain
MKTSPIAFASAVALALSLGGISALPAQPAAGQGAATSLEQPGMEQAGGLQDWLAGRRVEDVVGTDVYNRTGERIGEVEQVVRDTSDGSLHAIVSVGGFLGIGDTQISFPLLGMGMQDGNLIAPVDVGEERLEDRPGYEEGRFTPMQSAETLLIEEAPPATGAASAQQEPIPRKTLQTGMEDSGVELGGNNPGSRDNPGHGGSEPAAGGANSDAWWQGKRASDLIGQPVVNAAGQQLGEVGRVVIDPDPSRMHAVGKVVRIVTESDSDTRHALIRVAETFPMGSGDKLHAVVEVGGFLGIEQKDVAFPLSEMRSQEEGLATTTASTAEALKHREAFNPAGYVSVEPDRKLEDALAEAEQIETGPGFAELDEDGNQHLNRQEAAAAPGLIQNWQQADRDGDGRIDRAEFSAFEDQLRPGEPGEGERAGSRAGGTSREAPTAD